MRECVTHHHACDCREARFSRMEQVLEMFLNWVNSGMIISGSEMLSRDDMIAYLQSAINNGEKSDELE